MTKKIMKSCRWIETLRPYNLTWLQALNLSAMLNDAEKHALQPSNPYLFTFNPDFDKTSIFIFVKKK